MSLQSILVVDDDATFRDLLRSFLTYKGYQISLARDAKDALALLERNTVDLVITDMMMPGMTGLAFIKKVKELYPEIVTLACSGFTTAETTANLLKAGAFFCLEKPLDLNTLDLQVQRALEHRILLRPGLTGKGVVKKRSLMSNIVGESPKIRALLELVEKVADSDSTVLITGESGTGKELVAQAIHRLSSRHNEHFIPVNCGAIPEDLLESELFGHMKGSFTGAIANRVGRFALADRGTLFLDEIGDMPSSLQVKLLRVLQNREIVPVGGTDVKKIDTRIIAATHQNLEVLVENKVFREDLFYRLSVIPLEVPPLRERKEDIPLLVDSFLKRINREKMRQVTGIDQDVKQVLGNYHWPGNIRELENLIERLVIIKGSGVITLKDLPQRYRGAAEPAPPVPTVSTQSSEFHFTTSGICFNSVLEEFENSLIMEALGRTKGNKKEAAELLNLKRTTLIEKLKKKNLEFKTLPV